MAQELLLPLLWHEPWPGGPELHNLAVVCHSRGVHRSNRLDSQLRVNDDYHQVFFTFFFLVHIDSKFSSSVITC